MRGFTESHHVWKGEAIPPREAALLLVGRGAVVTGAFCPAGYQTGPILSALISAMDEQRPCRGGLSGDLGTARDRGSSCFSLLKEWVSQPTWWPYASTGAPAHAGTKTIPALLGGQGGHFEGHLCHTVRNCTEVI